MIDWFELLTVQGALEESFLAPQFKSINSLALSLLWASPVAQLVKNLPAMWETWV